RCPASRVPCICLLRKCPVIFVSFRVRLSGGVRSRSTFPRYKLCCRQPSGGLVALFGQGIQLCLGWRGLSLLAGNVRLLFAQESRPKALFLGDSSFVLLVCRRVCCAMLL